MTETSGQTYGVGHKTVQEHYLRLGRESMKSFLGPMPVEDFLDTFLHRRRIGNAGQPTHVEAFAGISRRGTRENRIYEPLVSRTIVSQKSDV